MRKDHDDAQVGDENIGTTLSPFIKVQNSFEK